MADTVEDILRSFDELHSGLETIKEEKKQLNDTIDKLELEQDLLDHWLTIFAEEDDETGLMEFIKAYLEYRDSMNVKDAVENVVEQQGLEENEE